jgi:hypothetical protein
MRKFYLAFSAAVIFLATDATAQSVGSTTEQKVANQNEINKKEVPVATQKFSTNSKDAFSKEGTKESTQELKTDENQKSSNSIGIEGSNQAVTTTSITKADFDLMSEERRKHILAHPELYKVEQ